MVLRVQRERSRRSEVQAILSATPQKGEWYVWTEGRGGIGGVCEKEGVGVRSGRGGRKERGYGEGGRMCVLHVYGSNRERLRGTSGRGRERDRS